MRVFRLVTKHWKNFNGIEFNNGRVMIEEMNAPDSKPKEYLNFESLHLSLDITNLDYFDLVPQNSKIMVKK